MEKVDNIEEKIRVEIENLKIPCFDNCPFLRRLFCIYSCEKLIKYQEKEEDLYRRLQDCWYIKAKNIKDK